MATSSNNSSIDDRSTTDASLSGNDDCFSSSSATTSEAAISGTSSSHQQSTLWAAKTEEKNDDDGIGACPKIIERIRPPHANDVLCGKGNGIVNHPGNIAFREYIRERKEEYNFASSSASKLQITKDIVHRVQSLDPPGRFLQKDESNPDEVTYDEKGIYTGYWLEADASKAMAKTSQALREGGPTIRANARKILEVRRAGGRGENSAAGVDSTGTSSSTPSSWYGRQESMESLTDQEIPYSSLLFNLPNVHDEQKALDGLTSRELKDEANRIMSDMKQKGKERSGF